MQTLGIYSKGTKELMAVLEISDEAYELLKAQKDPSKTFEQLIVNWMKSEAKKSKKVS